ncbi:hypothetical protein AB1M95_00375 [Sulfitobacter sp. LCG007]
MLAFLRLLVGAFAVLTIVYVCLSFYSRARRREKLEREWDEHGGPGTRAEFVARGLEGYDGSLRRRLILGVYVVPLAIVALTIYLTNYT